MGLAFAGSEWWLTLWHERKVPDRRVRKTVVSGYIHFLRADTDIYFFRNWQLILSLL